MKKSSRIPVIFWRVLSRLNQRMISHYRPGSKAAGNVLVLTTIGRRSGQPRSTPLQFEEVEGVYYVASARAEKADCYRNLVACPQVKLQVENKYISTLAKPMTEPGEIADFLELHMLRHPHLMSALLRLEGLPVKYSREDLEKFAERLALVALPENNKQTSKQQ